MMKKKSKKKSSSSSKGSSSSSKGSSSSSTKGKGKKKKKKYDLFVDSSKGGGMKKKKKYYVHSSSSKGSKSSKGGKSSKGSKGGKEPWWVRKPDEDCIPLPNKGRRMRKRRMKKSSKGSNGKYYYAPTKFCPEEPTTSPPTGVPTTSPPTSTPQTASPTQTAGLVESLPIEITDAGVTTVTWVVPTSCIIADLNVELALDHVEVGDLKIWLETPGGMIVGLLDRPGATGAADSGFSSDLIAGFPITFDDASTNNPELLGSTGTPTPPETTVFSFGPFPPVNGNPEATLFLNDLNGNNAVGTWTVAIADELAFLTGSLEGVSLDFTCA